MNQFNRCADREAQVDATNHMLLSKPGCELSAFKHQGLNVLVIVDWLDTSISQNVLKKNTLGQSSSQLIILAHNWTPLKGQPTAVGE